MPALVIVLDLYPTCSYKLSKLISGADVNFHVYTTYTVGLEFILTCQCNILEDVNFPYFYRNPGLFLLFGKIDETFKNFLS